MEKSYLSSCESLRFNFYPAVTKMYIKNGNIINVQCTIDFHPSLKIRAIIPNPLKEKKKKEK